MQSDELTPRGERDPLAGQRLGFLKLSPSGEQPRRDTRALDLPLAIGGRWRFIDRFKQREGIVVSPLLVHGAGQIDGDG